MTSDSAHVSDFQRLAETSSVLFNHNLCCHSDPFDRVGNIFCPICMFLRNLHEHFISHRRDFTSKFLGRLIGLKAGILVKALSSSLENEFGFADSRPGIPCGGYLCARCGGVNEADSNCYIIDFLLHYSFLPCSCDSNSVVDRGTPSGSFHVSNATTEPSKIWTQKTASTIEVSCRRCSAKATGTGLMGYIWVWNLLRFTRVTKIAGSWVLLLPIDFENILISLSTVSALWMGMPELFDTPYRLPVLRVRGEKKWSELDMIEEEGFEEELKLSRWTKVPSTLCGPFDSGLEPKLHDWEISMPEEGILLGGSPAFSRFLEIFLSAKKMDIYSWGGFLEDFGSLMNLQMTANACFMNYIASKFKSYEGNLDSIHGTPDASPYSCKRLLCNVMDRELKSVHIVVHGSDDSDDEETPFDNMVRMAEALDPDDGYFTGQSEMPRFLHVDGDDDLNENLLDYAIEGEVDEEGYTLEHIEIADGYYDEDGFYVQEVDDFGDPDFDPYRPEEFHEEFGQSDEPIPEEEELVEDTESVCTVHKFISTGSLSDIIRDGANALVDSYAFWKVPVTKVNEVFSDVTTFSKDVPRRFEMLAGRPVICHGCMELIDILRRQEKVQLKFMEEQNKEWESWNSTFGVSPARAVKELTDAVQALQLKAVDFNSYMNESRDRLERLKAKTKFRPALPPIQEEVSREPIRKVASSSSDDDLREFSRSPPRSMAPTIPITAYGKGKTRREMMDASDLAPGIGDPSKEPAVLQTEEVAGGMVNNSSGVVPSGTDHIQDMLKASFPVLDFKWSVSTPRGTSFQKIMLPSAIWTNNARVRTMAGLFQYYSFDGLKVVAHILSHVMQGGTLMMSWDAMNICNKQSFTNMYQLSCLPNVKIYASSNSEKELFIPWSTFQDCISLTTLEYNVDFVGCIHFCVLNGLKVPDTSVQHCNITVYASFVNPKLKIFTIPHAFSGEPQADLGGKPKDVRSQRMQLFEGMESIVYAGSWKESDSESIVSLVPHPTSIHASKGILYQTPLSIISNLFAKWRGGLIFKFIFGSSGFTRGSLMFLNLLGSKLENAVSKADVRGLPSAIFELLPGVFEVDFMVPFNSVAAFSHVYNNYIYDVSGYNAELIVSRLHAIVEKPLITNFGAATSLDFVVTLRPAADLEVAFLQGLRISGHSLVKEIATGPDVGTAEAIISNGVKLLVNQFCEIATVDLDGTKEVDKRYFQIFVSPYLRTQEPTSSVLGYLAQLHVRWKGDLIYRLTATHHSRKKAKIIRLWHQPNGDLIGDSEMEALTEAYPPPGVSFVIWDPIKEPTIHLRIPFQARTKQLLLAKKNVKREGHDFVIYYNGSLCLGLEGSDSIRVTIAQCAAENFEMLDWTAPPTISATGKPHSKLTYAAKIRSIEDVATIKPVKIMKEEVVELKPKDPKASSSGSTRSPSSGGSPSTVLPQKNWWGQAEMFRVNGAVPSADGLKTLAEAAETDEEEPSERSSGSSTESESDSDTDDECIAILKEVADWKQSRVERLRDRIDDYASMLTSRKDLRKNEKRHSKRNKGGKILRRMLKDKRSSTAPPMKKMSAPRHPAKACRSKPVLTGQKEMFSMFSTLWSNAKTVGEACAVMNGNSPGVQNGVEKADIVGLTHAIASLRPAAESLSKNMPKILDSAEATLPTTLESLGAFSKLAHQFVGVIQGAITGSFPGWVWAMKNDGHSTLAMIATLMGIAFIVWYYKNSSSMSVATKICAAIGMIWAPVLGKKMLQFAAWLSEEFIDMCLRMVDKFASRHQDTPLQSALGVSGQAEGFTSFVSDILCTWDEFLVPILSVIGVTTSLVGWGCIPDKHSLTSFYDKFTAAGDKGRTIGNLAAGYNAISSFVCSLSRNIVSWAREKMGTKILKEDATVAALVEFDIPGWIERVRELSLEENRAKNVNDPQLIEEKRKLYDRGEAINRAIIDGRYNMSPSVGALVMDARKKCEMILNDTHACKGMGKERIDPVHFCFAGPPGVGKSAMSMSFIHTLLNELDYPKVDRVYTRNPADQYWSRYHNEPVVFYDDLGAIVAKGASVSDYGEIIGCKTNGPFSLNMAELNEKGRFFTSHFLVSTTNPTMLDTNTDVRTADAFYRRRDWLVDVQRDPDSIKDPSDVTKGLLFTVLDSMNGWEVRREWNDSWYRKERGFAIESVDFATFMQQAIIYTRGYLEVQKKLLASTTSGVDITPSCSFNESSSDASEAMPMDIENMIKAWEDEMAADQAARMRKGAEVRSYHFNLSQGKPEVVDDEDLVLDGEELDASIEVDDRGETPITRVKSRKGKGVLEGPSVEAEAFVDPYAEWYDDYEPPVPKGYKKREKLHGQAEAYGNRRYNLSEILELYNAAGVTGSDIVSDLRANDYQLSALSSVGNDFVQQFNSLCNCEKGTKGFCPIEYLGRAAQIEGRKWPKGFMMKCKQSEKGKVFEIYFELRGQARISELFNRKNALISFLTMKHYFEAAGSIPNGTCPGYMIRNFKILNEYQSEGDSECEGDIGQRRRDATLPVNTGYITEYDGNRFFVWEHFGDYFPRFARNCRYMLVRDDLGPIFIVANKTHIADFNRVSHITETKMFESLVASCHGLQAKLMRSFDLNELRVLKDVITILNTNYDDFGIDHVILSKGTEFFENLRRLCGDTGLYLAVLLCVYEHIRRRDKAKTELRAQKLKIELLDEKLAKSGEIQSSLMAGTSKGMRTALIVGGVVIGVGALAGAIYGIIKILDAFGPEKEVKHTKEEWVETEVVLDVEESTEDWTNLPLINNVISERKRGYTRVPPAEVELKHKPEEWREEEIVPERRESRRSRSPRKRAPRSSSVKPQEVFDICPGLEKREEVVEKICPEYHVSGDFKTKGKNQRKKPPVKKVGKDRAWRAVAEMIELANSFENPGPNVVENDDLVILEPQAFKLDAQWQDHLAGKGMLRLHDTSKKSGFVFEKEGLEGERRIVMVNNAPVVVPTRLEHYSHKVGLVKMDAPLASKDPEGKDKRLPIEKAQLELARSRRSPGHRRSVKQRGEMAWAKADTNGLLLLKGTFAHACAVLACPDKNVKIQCIRVAGSWILVPAHFFMELVADDELVMLCFERMMSFRWRPDRSFMVSSTQDLILMDAGPRVPLARNILHHFVSIKDLSVFKNCAGVLTTVTFDKNGITQWVDQIPTIELVEPNVNQPTVGYEIRDGQTHYISTGFRYGLQSTFGYCGSMIVRLDPGVNARICGVHVAGSMSHAVGYAEFACREALEKIINQCDGDMFDGDFLHQPPLLGTKEAWEFEPIVDFDPIPNIPVVAVMDPHEVPQIVTLTRISPSPIFDLAIKHETEPSILSTRDPRLDEMQYIYQPLLEGVKKYSQECSPMSNFGVMLVERHLIAHYSVMNNSLSRRQVLSIEEAINGIPGSDLWRAVNMDSSPGFPYVMERRDSGESGKSYLFEDLGYYPNGQTKYGLKEGSVLAKRLAKRHDDARRGVISPIWTVECLKDERRKLKKIYQDPSTRVFSILPVDMNILYRMYFLDFAVMVMENRHNSFCQVGINPDSIEWTQLMISFQQKSMFGFAGDYKQFDGIGPPEIYMSIVNVANSWYDDGEENARIRRILIIQMFQRFTLMGNCVLRINQGMPSGFSMTVIFNSILNYYFLGMAWIRTLDSSPLTIYADLESFDKYCKVVTYGDDNVVAVDPRFLDFYNLRSVALWLDSFGITYTDDAKRPIAESDPYVMISMVTFLKRGFAKNSLCPMLWHAPLDVVSITDQINWVKDGNEPFEAFMMNAKNACYEMSILSEHQYNTFVDKINDALKQICAPLIVKDYEGERCRWWKNHLGMTCEAEMIALVRVWEKSKLDPGALKVPRLKDGSMNVPLLEAVEKLIYQPPRELEWVF